MKRKYFSRGLGLGILVTALLFALGLLFYKPSLSDEEIKARATLLGMTETSDRRITSETSASSSAASSAADSSASSSASSSSAASSAESSAAASSAETSASAEPENTPTSAAETPAASTEPEPSQPEPSHEEITPQEPAPAEPAQNEPAPETPSAPEIPAEPVIPENPGGNVNAGDELKSVTISPQETSLKVSENLYRAGIISDPVDFNKYLEANGYDYSIQTGTYWISPNASYETIAHAITNK